ncbi:MULTISPECIES: AAA family ATPase [Providencia]|uniref:AAA family ATPase n=1 Tax=Providencia TaxID=586 RepID=UPI001B363E49|nr:MULTISPECIES: AAA family ATPase [Providencia]EJD6507121.1 AAA family ATPase [Providencia rettgeri]ELR5199045.1 AAA family ATPase [Providencia rettgeri]MBQ0315525.1 AAA family ATPase [Providencia rettgeri]MBQ0323741.1 AAA family ATPase [Providencia rettgeri]MBQ0351251.1 AAA family ATPase [Providencia rettgeri]
MKINIIGTSGSGKTTLCQQLASLLNVPSIELDSLYWLENWQGSSDEALNQKLSAALNESVSGWVLDGNYTRTQPIKWKEVDMVVWLDYSLPRTLYQSIIRTLSRIRSGQELWENTGNKESWKNAFFSRNSIILWQLKTYYPNKRRNLKHMANINLRHIQFVRLTSPKETRLFFEHIKSQI